MQRSRPLGYIVKQYPLLYSRSDCSFGISKFNRRSNTITMSDGTKGPVPIQGIKADVFGEFSHWELDAHPFASRRPRTSDKVGGC